MIRIAVVGGLNRFLQLLIADVEPQRRAALDLGKWSLWGPPEAKIESF